MATILHSPKCYTIGWLAALPIERAAALAMLDEEHRPPEGFCQHPADTNSYTWGCVSRHNVVIASLPAGLYGTTTAAATVSGMRASLPHLQFGLLVGIAGGIPWPSPGPDIRLGDVVVSRPEGGTGGVFQYDLGMADADADRIWEHTGPHNEPPQALLSAMDQLRDQHKNTPSRMPELLREMTQKYPTMSPKYGFQGTDNDRLFQATYSHAGGKTCADCEEANEITRDDRETTDPRIHYGIVACGNTLVKDAPARDELVRLSHQPILCVEMEAAGMMGHFPCLVIRGICDYADSHKNDRWQRYASAVAAAYAKELLGVLPVEPQLDPPPGGGDAARSAGGSMMAWARWLGGWR